MSRTISQSALQAMLAQQTDEVVLVALQIDHADMAAPLKFVNDTQDLTRADGEYIGFPFQIKFPEDTEDNTPQVSIVIDNVDQRVIKEIRALQGPPDITIEIILRSQPDTPEVGPLTMKLKKVDYNALAISGTISYSEDFLNEPYPKNKFTPKTAAGMFS